MRRWWRPLIWAVLAFVIAAYLSWTEETEAAGAACAPQSSLAPQTEGCVIPSY